MVFTLLIGSIDIQKHGRVFLVEEFVTVYVLVVDQAGVAVDIFGRRRCCDRFGLQQERCKPMLDHLGARNPSFPGRAFHPKKFTI